MLREVMMAMLLVACIRASVVFTHVPKSGGTSLSKELRSQAPDRKAYREAFPRSITPAAEWVRSGKPGAEWNHVPYRDLPTLPAGTILITLIRDPIERVRSAYRFNRDNVQTEFTALLRHVPLDVLVRQWQRYPELAMQLWQPQLVLFFSDDPLPQRTWIERNGCAGLEGCAVPDRVGFAREWISARSCWEKKANSVIQLDMMNDERNAIALVCAQKAAGLLEPMRGKTEQEKLLQAMRYSLGRAPQASNILLGQYAAVLRLETLDLKQLEGVVPWFARVDAHDLHTNSSPAEELDDSSNLSLDAYNILRTEVLVDDYAVLSLLRMN